MEVVACIDQSSPAATMDMNVVRAAVATQGYSARFEKFDGSGVGDDPYSEKNFHKLTSSRCQLVLGFPVDVQAPLLPTGVKGSAPYGQTGFALVTRDHAPPELSQLAEGTEVAVAYETAPNLFFEHHTNIQSDVHPDNADALDALAKGKVKAAMLWAPIVVQYTQRHAKGHKLFFALLNEPHARWDLVALYDDSGVAAVEVFEKGVGELRASGRLAALLAPYAVVGERPTASAVKPANVVSRNEYNRGGLIKVSNTKKKSGAKAPAIYSAEQASAGQQVFMSNCSMCHGADLGGITGPALKGQKFASAKDDFAVSDIFGILSTQMPAGRPGTLKPEEYAAVMAFILQQNGYPAGPNALTYAQAQTSKVPLISSSK